MLNQNLTTLLSTLFGGLLAIIGGVVTNYYIQSTTNKTGKQKEIKNLIEKIYEYTRDNFYLVDDMLQDPSLSHVGTKKYKDFEWNLYNMQMLVDLYLPPLREPFETYNQNLRYLVSDIQVPHRSQKPQPLTYNPTQAFRESLIALLRKEGFSYF